MFAADMLQRVVIYMDGESRSPRPRPCDVCVPFNPVAFVARRGRSLEAMVRSLSWRLPAFDFIRDIRAQTLLRIFFRGAEIHEPGDPFMLAEPQ